MGSSTFSSRCMVACTARRPTAPYLPLDVKRSIMRLGNVPPTDAAGVAVVDKVVRQVLCKLMVVACGSSYRRQGTTSASMGHDSEGNVVRLSLKGHLNSTACETWTASS